MNYYTINHPNIDYAYQPQSFVNNNIHNEANIHSNWNYRRYIQKNANEIMKYNSMEAINDSGNNPFTLYNNVVGPNVPIVYKNIYQPSNSINNSDLKKQFLQKEQINARMVSPSIPTNKF